MVSRSGHQTRQEIDTDKNDQKNEPGCFVHAGLLVLRAKDGAVFLGIVRVEPGSPGGNGVKIGHADMLFANLKLRQISETT